MTRCALLVVLLLARSVAADEGHYTGWGEYTTDPDPRPPRSGPDPTSLTPAHVLMILRSAAQDPSIAQQVLRLDSRTISSLPPEGALIAADVLTQHGQVRRARRLYAQVLERTHGQSPWEDAARSGLGYSSVASGDFSGAREYLVTAPAGSPSSSLARVLVALVDATEAHAGAAQELERLSGDPAIGPRLRDVARIGVGYAHFWAGDMEAARRAFDRVLEGPFADDAAYGAAWSQHVAGDDETARVALQDLARRPATSARRPVSPRRVRLEASAVLRSGLPRRRELQVGADDGWLAEMLDGDGPQIARAALRLLARPDDEPSAPRPEAATLVSTPAVGAPSPLPAEHARMPVHGGTPRAPEHQGGWETEIMITLGLAVLAAVVLWRRGISARA